MRELAGITNIAPRTITAEDHSYRHQLWLASNGERSRRLGDAVPDAAVNGIAQLGDETALIAHSPSLEDAHTSRLSLIRRRDNAALASLLPKMGIGYYNVENNFAELQAFLALVNYYALRNVAP